MTPKQGAWVHAWSAVCAAWTKLDALGLVTASQYALVMDRPPTHSFHLLPAADWSAMSLQSRSARMS